MKNKYKTLIIFSLILVYLVIAAGSVVRMTGSGMGCPDWPKCFGYLIPPTERAQLDWKPSHEYQKGEVIVLNKSLRVVVKDFISLKEYNKTNWSNYTKHNYALFNSTHTWIEFINRLLGALAGLATLLLLISALIRIKKDVWASIVSLLIVFGMGFQAWLGKTVVDSNLLPFKITIHMTVALIIVLLLVFLLQREKVVLEKIPKSSSFIWVLGLGLILTLIQIGMGTQVRQFIDDQMHSTNLKQASEWLKYPPFLFYVHRSFSLIVIMIHGYLAFKLYENKYIPRVFTIIISLIGFEILTGIWMYYFDFPFSSQPLHLVLASLLFGAQSYFMITVKKQL